MTSPALKLFKSEYSECLICKKPLGADSKDTGFMFCHEHRKCHKCNEDITIMEARLCLRTFLDSNKNTSPLEELDYTEIEIVHPKCSGRVFDPQMPIKQSDLDYLNNIRLSVMPDLNLSQVTNENSARLFSDKVIAGMSFEELNLHLKMLESCVANVGMAIRHDKEYKKNFLAEREKEQFARIKEKEAKEAPKASPKDLQLEAMVEKHGLDPTDKKGNLKLLSDRNKTIRDLMKNLSLTESQAIAYCDKQLIQGGRFKK